MNMVYICDYDLFENYSIGVKKKIYGQMEAFADKGYKPNLIYRDENKCYVINYLSNKLEYFLYSDRQEAYNYMLSKCEVLNPKVIYIRQGFSDYFLIEFYKKLKSECKFSKMIAEFPTLPYDEEQKEAGKILDIDKFYRLKLKDVFDLSVNFSGFDSTFGIESLIINNGVSIKNIPIKKKTFYKEKEIHLILVANILKVHGFIRIVKGLSEYYENGFKELGYIIKMNVVGNGAYLDCAKKEVDKYNMENYIKFLGNLESNELDDIFEISDIAIGVLGFYINKLEVASPLKTKEYCARGIPFIIAYTDIAFNKELEFEYIMKFENNENSVNMYKIIEFYNKIKNITGLPEKMRKYAEDNLTWEKCFEKLFNRI